MSALSRMANRDHPIRIGEGDTVILASSLIPGNENAGLPGHQRAVPLGRQGRAQGQRAGARLRPRVGRRAALRATTSSGPSNVMPVHGEWRHLRANADLAVATGVPRDRIVLAEDGVVVDLVDGRAEHRRRGAVRLRLRRRLQRRRRHRVVAQGPADPARRGLHLGRRRRRLGRPARSPAGPEIHARGFAEDDAVFDAVCAR